ncbi:MAG: DUF11 domain-containing protein [Hellea sp.]|nr:DUF11 domain-containing protein [Hellea sp.]
MGIRRKNVFRVGYSIVCWVLATLSVSGLALAAPPTFSKTFSPDTIGPGGTTTLTFTIDSTGNAVPVTDMAFTDVLPVGLTIATPSNASHDCVAGTLTAPNGGGTVTFADGSIGSGAFCTVSVDVTSSTVGTHMNVSGDLTSSEGNSGTATDDLMVVSTLPGFTKSFSPSSTSLGGTSTLTFTIDNTSNTAVIGNLDFTDNFPTGMEIASPPNANTDCVSALINDTTLTAVAGATSMALDANGSTLFPGAEVLSAGAACTVSVNVTATGVGMLNNISGNLLSDFVSAGAASATLAVTATALQLNKTFNGDPVLPGATVELEFTIQNTNRTGVATAVAFTNNLAATLTGLTYTSLTSNDCGGSVAGVGTTSISFSGGTIAPEGSCTIVTSLTVPGTAATGSYPNTTSSITATIGGSPSVGAAATDTLFIEAAQPQLSMSFTNDPIGSGDTVDLEFTVMNPNAAGAVTDLTFIDELTTFLPSPISSTLPAAGSCGAGSTFAIVSTSFGQALSMSGGNLPASGSCTFNFGVDIPAGFPGGSYPNTTSDITGTFAGAAVTGPPASDTLVVNGGATVTLAKEFTDDPVDPGDAATLVFTITSSAESTVDATALAFTDDLNAALTGLTYASLTSNSCGGTVTGVGTTSIMFTGGTVTATGTCSIEVSTTVPPAAGGGSYTNTTSNLTGTAGGVGFTASPATADLIVSSDITFTKEFLTNPVAQGDTTNLRFTIDNAGTSVESITFFTDNLAASLPGLTATLPPVTNTCGGTMSGTTFLTYIGGTLPANSSCIIEVVTTVPVSSSPGIYRNVTSDLITSAGILAPATDTLEVRSAAFDLSLTKEFTNDPVEPGQSVNLEFTLANDNTVNGATVISFTDDLDAMLTGTVATGLPVAACGGTLSGTSTISLSGASVAANDNCTFSVAVSIPAAAAAATYSNSTSDVYATMGGVASSIAGANADLVVSDGSATFTKSFTNDPAVPGGTVNLEFSIANTGTGGLTDMRFTDDLDATLSGLVATGLPANDICGSGSSLSGTSNLSFTGGNLNIGGDCTFSVTLQVPAGAMPGSSNSNTTSDLTSGTSVVAAPATDSLDIQAPEIEISSSESGAVADGGTDAQGNEVVGTAKVVTYTITNTGGAALNLTNAGPSLSGGVNVGMPTPGNYSSATVAASGGTATFTVTYTPQAAGAFSFDIDVLSDDSDESPYDIALSGTGIEEVDISVTKTDGVTSAAPGSSLTYTIVAANAGPSADPSVTLTDTFPADLTCTYTSVAAGGLTGNTASGSGDISETLSMPSGSSATYTAICAIDADATGTLSNTASATSSITDTVPGNNSATDSDTVLSPESDLSITKTDGVTSAAQGSNITYTIVASNAGPSTETAALVTDNFPSDLTCTHTSSTTGGASGISFSGSGDISETLNMPSGSTATYSAICAVGPTATGTLSNTATISGSNTDPASGNNSATDADTVISAEADLSVTMTDSVDPVTAGSNVTYTSLVTNAGPSPATNTIATFTLPAGVTFVSTSGCAADPSGIPACSLGTISASGNASFNVTVSVNAATTADLTASVSVASDAIDNVPGFNSDTEVTSVNEIPVADAGPDQPSAVEATLITLDGSGSSDGDMDSLTYAWSQTAGTTVTLSSTTAVGPTFTAPVLASNTPEVLTFSLIVNDGAVDSVSDTVDITINNINEAPISVAGPDQPSVVEATLVTLDGSGSSDPDGDGLTYAWSQTAGAAVTLSSSTAVGPTFTAPSLSSNAPETLTFSLIVNDGTVDSVADTVNVVIGNINELPLADAGPDQGSVTESTLVTLDGSGSSDPDGDGLTYGWSQAAGTPVMLSSATAEGPSFTAPTLSSNTPETLTFSLIVNDGFVDSVADTVDITINNVNEVPVADAGADQPAVLEATVATLDGSGSSDPDGDGLTYAWIQSGGTTVTLSSSTAASPTFTTPTLGTNTPETLTFSLVVNDGTLDSPADTVDITINNVNETPLADAGPDQPSASEATVITLDGSASSDPDGDALTYAWTQTVGTTVTLSDTTAAGPTFTAPTLSSNTPETLTFSLIVNDGIIDSVADTVDVTINNVNETPLADAGPDQDPVLEASSVTLDGSGSSDPDGDSLTYAWTQTSGTSVILSDASASSPTFTAPTLATNIAETLTFSLIVNDGTVDSVADTVDVVVTNINETPLADAGPDQPSVIEATMVTLDGSASSDPDGDALTYAWTQTSGTAVLLSDATAVGPTFTALTLTSNTPEVLTFSLIVNDGTLDSVTDTVDITVNNVNEAPVADAGIDQTGIIDATIVTLDGTGSSDPDGDSLTFAWTQTSGPSVTLSSSASNSPTFTAPALTATTTLTFSLIVNDGQVDSVADTVDIEILENMAPTVVISGVPDTSNSAFTATFTFSEDVTGFVLGDIVLGNATASDFAGSGAVYTALITPSADGTVTIDVPAAVAQDNVGNDNTAAAQATTTFDATSPSVAIAALPADVRGPFVITVTFNEDVTGFTASDLVIDNGSASNLVSVSPSVYMVTITPTAHGTVTIEVPADAAQDAAGNGNTAGDPVSTEYIDEDFVRTRTMGIINNFLVRRADQITLNDPDLSDRFLNEGSDGRLNGHAERHTTRLAFNGSLSGEDANLAGIFGADRAAKINLWTEASLVSLHQDTTDNDLALIYAGIDYRVGDNTIIGIMGQYDWAEEEDRTQNFEISGSGWMVGPYMVTRLSDKLIFDGRAAWGKSSNDVSPFQTYTDNFKTNRWLLKGQFTGDFMLDDWRFNPNLSVIYFEEDQKAYVDSLNIMIPEQTISLGRMTFGPRFSKTFRQGGTTSITPNFGLRGIWDFQQADILNLNTGLATGTDKLRARAESGLTFGFGGDTRLTFVGFYDGIGATNYEAYGGKVGIYFPIE